MCHNSGNLQGDDEADLAPAKSPVYLRDLITQLHITPSGNVRKDAQTDSSTDADQFECALVTASTLIRKKPSDLPQQYVKVACVSRFN